MKVVIIGGLGFYGRHLYNLFIESCPEINVIVIDKTVPQTAYLNSHHSKTLKKCTYIQANLIHPPQDLFDADYIINATASDIRLGLSDEYYERNVVHSQINIAKAVSLHNHKRFVMISSPDVYSSKVPAKESETNPAHSLGEHFLRAEKAILDIPNLNCIIIRPAKVYGPGLQSGLMIGLCLARIAQYNQEKMIFPGSTTDRANTIHVQDLARAVLHICESDKISLSGLQRIYNLVDDGNTTLGDFARMVAEIFDIKTEFLSAFTSWISMKISRSDLAEDANDQSLGPWSSLLTSQGILHSPLSPWVEPDFLLAQTSSIDGTRFRTDTGFQLTYPKITTELVKEIVDDAKILQIFP